MTEAAKTLTPRLEKAVTEIAEYVEDILDNYEGNPRKFGEIVGKHRYYELLDALNEIGVQL